MELLIFVNSKFKPLTKELFIKLLEKEMNRHTKEQEPLIVALKKQFYMNVSKRLD